MKIRTQIALAFLLLAIVPMAAIVSYSYHSSLRTVRRALETEAEALAADMETRMGNIRGEIQRRVERIGAKPLEIWRLEQETEAEREALYESVVSELGETAPLVETFEFVPEWMGAVPEAAPAPSADPAPPVGEVGEVGEPPRVAPVVIDMRGMLETVERSLQNLDPEAIPEADKEELLEHAKRGLAFVQEKAEQFNVKAGRVVQIRADLPEETGGGQEEGEEAHWEDESRQHEFEQVLLTGAAALAEAAAEDPPGTSYRFLYEPEVGVPVYEDGTVVGQLRATVRDKELLRRVLASTRRASGEIPFAIDSEGALHALSEEDHETLLAIGLREPVDPATFDGHPIFDDWVVSARDDEATNLTFGIARPIEESIAEMRSTAFRNFGVGAGLLGLALLGVFPLSRRMTHGLKQVAEGAERLASGDLEARVSLRSGNEIGQLARAFNEMAQDLEENQQKLLAGERMQAEFERKSEELEDARRFQLSLLPKALPEHPSFELAATMRTATEVGGDYYDFRTGDDGSLTLAIGDATGHGAKAGTMVTVVKSLFSAYPPDGDLAGFQARAAAAIKQMALGRMSMALTVARLENHRLTLSAAGMPPVLVHRAGTGRVEEFALEGMPLGGLDFDYRELSVELQPGDLVLFMSDGYPELPNQAGDTLGYERAAQHFAAAGSRPGDVIRHLLATAEAWAGETDPADDMTFVVLRAR